MPPPPGYASYGSDGGYGGPIQRIATLTKALVTLAVLGACATALSLLVQLALRGKARELRNDSISLEDFGDELGPYLAVSAIAGLVALATLVVQIVWTFRIAKNLGVLGRQNQAFRPGATIAVNILGQCTLGILPYFMWRELWKGSDPTAPRGDPSWKQRPVGQIVHLWLAATLLTVIVSFGVGVGAAMTRVNRGSDESIAKQLDDRFGIVVLAAILGIVTSVLFIGLVRQLSARHMQATGET